MKKILAYILVSGLALSCVYPYDDVPEGSDELIPVFDGNIVVGDRAVLSFSWMENLEGNTPSVHIGENDFSWWVEDDAGERYSPAVGISGVDLSGAPEDRAYRIHIFLLGETYVSSWQKALEPPVMEDIRFTANENTVTVDVSFSDPGTDIAYAAVTFDETWEFHVDFLADYEIDTETWQISEVEEQNTLKYYCWRSQAHRADNIIDLSRTGHRVLNYPITRFNRRDSRNHRKYSILVKVRTLSEEEYRYKHNLEVNDDGGNNLFRPQPGEMPGNIVCTSTPDKQVLGFVSMSKVNTLRAFLDNRYLLVVEPDDSELLVPQPEQYESFYYNIGYRPIKDVVREGELGIGWGPLRCIDCTAAGGTLIQPDFWQ